MNPIRKLWKLLRTRHTAHAKQAPEKQYPYEVRVPYPGENMDDFFGGPPRGTWDPRGARQRVIAYDSLAGTETIRVDTRDLVRQYNEIMAQVRGEMPRP